MFTHILLPSDGSTLSQVAVQKGVQFAKRIGAKVTGLCVVPTKKHQIYTTVISEQLQAETAKQHRLQADRILAFIAKTAAEAGVACETVCENGDHPHEIIIDTAAKRGCDLIMMASHGLKGVKGLLLGSETQKVLTHSKMPVLVVR
ncbi:MAG: universal stress protein [Desulfobacterales bacterium]|jgi:nucleotide-binding universal stress UspA family protein|nr:universal stress protein [Desulfobacterales bacterium]